MLKEILLNNAQDAGINSMTEQHPSIFTLIFTTSCGCWDNCGTKVGSDFFLAAFDH
jgi:hypothetical protein